MSAREDNTPTLSYVGQQFHHFHGGYWASLTLASHRPEQTPILHEHVRQQMPDLDPTKISVLRSGLVVRGTSDELRPLLEFLEQHRVDEPCRLFDCAFRNDRIRHPIGSCAHSIGVGPVFEVALPVIDLLTPLRPFRKDD